jgi:hypothetical protein
MEKSDSESECRREAAWLMAVERTCSDDAIRRELLWYRAMEKADSWARRDLEHFETVRAVAVRVRDRYHPERMGPKERRQLYARLYDERFAAAMGRPWEEIACDCTSCQGGYFLAGTAADLPTGDELERMGQAILGPGGPPDLPPGL